MVSEFTKKVWEICKKIPKGKVSTYSQIAKVLGKPKAARAVGNSLNKSPGMPKVPCHRVIKQSGEIGGFAFGEKKEN